MPRSGRRVPDHCDLEALLKELAQVGFDAQCGQHATKQDLGDPTLAELQNQVIGLWPEDLVRADDHRLAVLDVGLETLKPIGARILEARQGQRAGASKRVCLELVGLKRPVHSPALIGRIEIVRRDENLVSPGLRGLEDFLHVLDRAILADARTDCPPVCSFLTQHVVLRIDEYHCRIAPLNVHACSPPCLAMAAGIHARSHRSYSSPLTDRVFHALPLASREKPLSYPNCTPIGSTDMRFGKSSRPVRIPRSARSARPRLPTGICRRFQSLRCASVIRNALQRQRGRWLMPESPQQKISDSPQR